MSAGAEWAEDGTARIYATGRSGQGEITGLRPDVLMYFAVILARNARAYGAAWPSAGMLTDPFEAMSVEALKLAVGERQPLTDAQLALPAPVIEDALRARVEDATDQLSNAIGNLAGVLETLSSAGQLLDED